MTEDDTFRRLIRTPYKEVHELYHAWLAQSPLTKAEDPNQSLNDFFKPHGWTWESYLDVWDKSIGL